jgi:frataxin-like iron-binding protein CyaY
VWEQKEALRKGGQWPPKTWPLVEDAFNGILDLVEKCWTISPINTRPEASKLETALQAISDKFAKQREDHESLLRESFELSQVDGTVSALSTGRQVSSQLPNPSAWTTRRSGGNHFNSTQENRLMSQDHSNGPMSGDSDAMPSRIGRFGVDR